MRKLTLLLLSLSSAAFGQTLFDGGAPALPITKVDAHPRTLPLQNVVTAGDTNSIVTNIQMIENVLLGDAGFPSYDVASQGGGWKTAYFCDFSSLAYTPLDGGDGTNYNLCGVNWTVMGTGSDGHSFWGYEELDAGLVMQQYDAGDISTGECGGQLQGHPTGLYVAAAPLIPGLQADTPLRLTVAFKSFAVSASDVQDHVSMELATRSSLFTYALGACVDWQGSNTGRCADNSAQTAWGTTAPWDARTVMQATMPSGYDAMTSTCRVSDGGQPYIPTAYVTQGTFSTASNQGTDGPDQLLMRLFVGRATNHTPPLTGVVRWVKLEYHP